MIIAETAYSEEPDLDACRIITRVLWILILLPFLLIAGAACLFFRRSSPINLFAMLGVFRFLNPVAHNNVQVPVRYFRVREEGSAAEVMVRMKGQLTASSVGRDDILTISGRSRGGTLYAKSGFNHRTASTIQLAHSYSWIGLILTLVVILSLLIKSYEPSVKVARTIHSVSEGAAR